MYNGEKKGDDDENDFLDRLLEKLIILFGDTPADYTQYVCEEAYTGKPLEINNSWIYWWSSKNW